MLSPTSKVKLAVVGLAALGIGGAALYNSMFGAATVHLVVPSGHSVELSANGQVVGPTSSAREHLRFEFKQGDYTFALKNKESGEVRSYTLKLTSGFDHYVLPLSEKQCFTRLDVTQAMYGNNGEAAPIVMERISAQAPFKKGSSDYLDESEMPKSIKRGTKVNLLAEVDCDALRMNDQALLGEVGF